MNPGGPVAIAGADGHVGRWLVGRLGELGVEARPIPREGDAAAAIAGCATVVHLAGALAPEKPNTYELANVGTVRRTVEGIAQAGGVERLAYVSYVGASPSSRNAYLRSKGQAEELVRDSGAQATILRCPLIIGEPSRPGPTAEAFLASGNKPIRALGDGRQLVAPLYAGDLVSMLVCVATGQGPAGTFELGGPETMPIDDLIHIINHPDISVRYTPVLAAAALVPFSRQLTSALVGVMGSDSVPIDHPRESAAAFGVELTPIDTVWPQAPLGG
ncbi:MAG: NAD-dependent epimerase/dehydratase family protein [Solirubrobacterales bacterium]